MWFDERVGFPAFAKVGPFPSNVRKVSKRKDLSLDLPGQACGLKAKARLLAGPNFYLFLF